MKNLTKEEKIKAVEKVFWTNTLLSLAFYTVFLTCAVAAIIVMNFSFHNDKQITFVYSYGTGLIILHGIQKDIIEHHDIMKEDIKKIEENHVS